MNESLAYRSPNLWLISIILRLNVVWALFSPIFVAMLFKLAPGHIWFFALKDMLLYGSLFLSLFLGFRTRALYQIVLLVIFLLYVIVNAEFLNPNYPSQLANIRQLISPIVILAYGVYASCPSFDIDKIGRFTCRWVGIVVLLGIFFILTDFWNHISLREYFTTKGIPVNSVGVSYMFYEPIIGYRERLVSTMLDPITLGHTLAALIICVWYGLFFQGTSRLWWLFVLSVGLLLTFSKGAMLEVALAIVFFNPRINFLFKWVAALFMAIVIAFLPYKAGLLIHFNGLVNAIGSTSLFGFGLGTVGNYAKMFAQDLSIYNMAGISDTFLGSVLGQLGIIGLLLWLWNLLSILKLGNGSHDGRVAKYIIISTLMVGTLSENTLNFSSFLLPGLISGLLIQRAWLGSVPVSQSDVASKGKGAIV